MILIDQTALSDFYLSLFFYIYSGIWVDGYLLPLFCFFSSFCFGGGLICIGMSEEIMENKMVSEGNVSEVRDTTYTKIFVGGLAWETRKDSLQSYFQQFGEIIEAVVIVDRNSGRSKGYGFVNFKDPDSAARACQNPCPMIDGRRANCNLAAFGSQKRGTFKPGTESRSMEPLNPHAPSAYFHQRMPQYAFPYSVFGYPLYPQDIYAMNNFYNGYGGKPIPFYRPAAAPASGSPGIYFSCYPPYAQHGQTSPSHYPKMIYNSQQHNAFGILSTPTSASSSLPNTEQQQKQDLQQQKNNSNESAKNSI